jgi:hypothetical protein
MHRCRRRTCSGYSALWAGDQRRKMFENLAAGPETVLMVTVTPPGRDRLPWDESACRPLGEHTHSGRLGCKVDRDSAATWNAAAPARWRRLHRRASERTRLQFAGALWMLARVWEMQFRGVLHVHVIVPFGTPREKAAARLYVQELGRCARRYDFGFVDRKMEVMSRRAAAAYLSSYFVTGKRKLTLQESVTHAHMPRSIVHVSTRLTMRTGCTMRRLRLHRFIWTRWGTSPLCPGDTWHTLDRYETGDSGVRLARAHGPPRPAGARA